MSKRKAPAAGDVRPDREALRTGLEATRDRTLQLVAPLAVSLLERQHSSLMSPISWDLGHIAAFEELWLVRRLGEVSSEQEIERAFDAFRTPRASRGQLAIPNVDFLERRLAEVRVKTLEGLETVDLASENPLLRDGYVYEMVRDHEAQHQETILQAILLIGDASYRPVIREPIPMASAGAPPPGFVRVPAGPFAMGDGSRQFCYDNERPVWEASTGAYEIARYPVTNAEYNEFIAAGGYADDTLWSSEGRHWREKEGFSAPGGWYPAGSSGPDRSEKAAGVPSPDEARAAARAGGMASWVRITALGEEKIRPDAPVAHVSYWEAEAYACFAGARLPNEREWEKAAAWDPRTGRTRRYPWGDEVSHTGRANLDQLRFGIAPVAAYPAGRSALGCWDMLGNLWEWTSSEFRGYPGFRPFPYEEYSSVFFGPEYRVLRGGSWATRPSVARTTVRNWDFPIRRQIFSGFRLARDV
ncbi:MAG: SUMF1/EgtB/PvdO family nonheme iron enzyme [Gemmatimonadota bacterium]